MFSGCLGNMFGANTMGTAAAPDQGNGFGFGGNFVGPTGPMYAQALMGMPATPFGSRDMR